MDYLAIDLGAGSGRAIAGRIENGKICLDEVHRFANKPVELGDTLYWDFLSLFDHVRQGIRLAIQKGYDLKGIAVDTWGVDYGLLDKDGRLLSNPVCYRDSRTDGMLEKVSGQVTPEQFYAVTGIQQMAINTVYQLFSQKENRDSALSVADRLLFTPDLVNYFLTGVISNEYTIASTSQLLDASLRQWSDGIFDRLQLPRRLVGEIIFPGSLIGRLRNEIAVQAGAGDISVYAAGSHDTASAIGAIPLTEDMAFLSSGTWSLMGVALDKPVLTENARIHEFTNEGGVNGQILFMRNMTGLWLLQQLMDEWEREGLSCSYDYLLDECLKAPAFQSQVDADDAIFNRPASMRKAIQDYCRESGQRIPHSQGELVRCVLESLALKYKTVMDDLQTFSGKSIKKLFVVGGGSQNRVLNQFIANALQMDVVTGLTEATAIGNLIQQAIAHREIADWNKAHEIIANSFTFTTYKPE